MSNIHDLINKERKLRGLSHVYWSKEMASLAQSQADYCAKVGHMVHSNRFAFQGGENLSGGKGNFSPRTVVNSWLKSKAGHREYLLSPRVTKAGVGIARRNGKMFVAWAFSSAPCTYPDCPSYKKKIQPIKFRNPLKIFVRRGYMPTNPFKIGLSLVLGFLGLLGIALGAHGIYVYFNRLEVIFGGEGSKLFLLVDVPIRIRDLVMWASIRGVQSWIIPTLILIGGLWLFNFSRLSSIVSWFLSKIRP